MVDIIPTYNPSYQTLTYGGVELVDNVPTKQYTITSFVPQVVSMRQARLALLESNLLATVDTAIAGGTDEALKIEWEYAQEVRRDWQSLIALATTLNITEQQLDELFILASTK